MLFSLKDLFFLIIKLMHVGCISKLLMLNKALLKFIGLSQQLFYIGHMQVRNLG